MGGRSVGGRLIPRLQEEHCCIALELFKKPAVFSCARWGLSPSLCVSALKHARNTYSNSVRGFSWRLPRLVFGSKKVFAQRRTWELATACVRWWRNDRPVHPSDSTAATDTTAIAATTALAIVTMPQASPFPSPPEPTISAAIHPRITRRQLSECDAVTITFGAPAGISHNNVGGRNSASDKYALIDKVGTFDGQHYNLKLTSALTNGDDPNCKSDAEGGAEAPCSIAINSASGTVDFFIRKKEATRPALPITTALAFTNLPRPAPPHRLCRYTRSPLALSSTAAILLPCLCIPSRCVACAVPPTTDPWRALYSVGLGYRSLTSETRSTFGLQLSMTPTFAVGVRHVAAGRETRRITSKGQLPTPQTA